MEYTHVRIPKLIKDMIMSEKLFIISNIDKVPEEILYPSKCLKCNSTNLEVLYTIHDGLIEVLKCKNCGYKFLRVSRKISKEELQSLFLKIGVGIFAGFALNALIYIIRESK